MEYLLLIILCCMWCAIHSGMISLSFDKFVRIRLESNYKFYRLLYNLVALATFVPLVLYELSLKGPVLFRWQGNYFFLQITLLVIVILLFISGGLKYDMPQLFGIRQIKSGRAHSTLSESGDINTSGILGITRHPWYLAAIIFIWICYRDMYISTFIFNIILSIYIIIGTVLEERKLIIELGDSYQDYKENVSMFFPTKWIFSKVKQIQHLG